MLEKKVVIQSTVVVEWLIILHFKYEVRGLTSFITTM